MNGEENVAVLNQVAIPVLVFFESQPDRGTLVRLVLPVLQAEEMGGSVVGAIYEERSRTSR